MTYNLNDIRKEIDNIDTELLPLLIKRIKCSENIAKYKIENNLPIYNKHREDEILANIVEKSGKYSLFSKILYSNIMSVSKLRQQELFTYENDIDTLLASSKKELPKSPSVLCQGTEGAYSHEAALKAFLNSSIIFAESFEDVFKGIKKGVADFAVLPVENSSAGSVSEVYSLIMKYKYYIVSAVNVPVSHCVAGLCESFDTVISHPQALLQCSNYISKKNLKQSPFINTASSANYVSEKKLKDTAAICSVDAAKRYNLKIFEKNIQDDKHNNTRFAVISKEPIFTNNANKISLCFSLQDKTGSLYKILEHFAFAGLDLTKIESRNISGKNFEYDFYLDFKGSVADKKVSSLICELSKNYKNFTFLGNYFEENCKK